MHGACTRAGETVLFCCFVLLLLLPCRPAPKRCLFNTFAVSYFVRMSERLSCVPIVLMLRISRMPDLPDLHQLLNEKVLGFDCFLASSNSCCNAFSAAAVSVYAHVHFVLREGFLSSCAGSIECGVSGHPA